jgi:UDP-N-acetylglucosamine--N-acetylmuramyl-(pentapeptide) pyrophosphoryl-undecaprenol N-acetylglucosamine transferase
MAKAHVMIARSGASTCAEIAVAAVPSLLVPLPGAIDDHQTANAAALVNAGLAQLLPQSTLTAEGLATLLAKMLNDSGALQRASASAATCSYPEAAGNLADIVESFVQPGVLTEGVPA